MRRAVAKKEDFRLSGDLREVEQHRSKASEAVSDLCFACTLCSNGFRSSGAGYVRGGIRKPANRKQLKRPTAIISSSSSDEVKVSTLARGEIGSERPKWA